MQVDIYDVDNNLAISGGDISINFVANLAPLGNFLSDSGRTIQTNNATLYSGNSNVVHYFKPQGQGHIQVDVTGGGLTSAMFTTVNVQPEAHELWHWTSPSPQVSEGYDTAINGAGRVYAARVEQNVPGAAASGNNGGNYGKDWVIGKPKFNGSEDLTESWPVGLNYQDDHDYLLAIAINNSDEVVAAGSVIDWQATVSKCVVKKFTSAGVAIDSKFFGSELIEAGGNCEYSSLAIDDGDGIVLVGTGGGNCRI